MKRIYYLISLALLSLICAPVIAGDNPWDNGHQLTDFEDPLDPDKRADSCGNTQGSPVFVESGYFVWSETDIALIGRPVLGLTRTYNSADPRDGHFGNGWVSNCEVALYTVVDFSIESGSQTKYILRLAGGKRYTYTIDDNGKINGPPNRNEQVEPQSNGTVRLAFPGGGHQLFAADGKLLSDIDRHGNKISYRYDDKSGALVRVSDDHQRFFEFQFNSAGRVISVSDHAQRTWHYAYDENGNLITVTNPLDESRHYEYQPFRPSGDGHTYYQLTKITDASGVVTTKVSYDKERVASYSEGENVYSYKHYPRYKDVEKEDLIGSKWRYRYEEELGQITEFRFGNSFEQFTYNQKGDITRYKDQQNNIWQATYDVENRLSSVINPLGDVTKYGYHGNSPWLHKIITASGYSTELTYDEHGRPLTIGDGSGVTLMLEWAEQGDLEAIIDPKKQRTEIKVNDAGLPIAVVDALGQTTRVEYDRRGNITKIISPDNKSTTITYDLADRPLTQTDALGITTKLRYDKAGRVVSVTDAGGGVTQYQYDEFGRLTQEKDRHGAIQSYYYRPDNLYASIKRFDAVIESFEYNKKKQLVAHKVGDLQTTYAYDSRGALLRAKNETGYAGFTYDKIGRIKTENIARATNRYTYNEDGEVTHIKAANGETNYIRQKNGLVSNIKTKQGDFNYSYDANGWRQQLDFPDNHQTQYQLDAVGRLEGLAHSGNFSASYNYDFNDLSQITTWTGDDEDWQYQYDKSGRLLEAVHGAKEYSYDYDERGNRLDNEARYDEANRLVENSQYYFDYDLNGNLVAKEEKSSGITTRYVWNARNQLIKVEKFDKASPDSTIFGAEYTYGPLGRRWSKIINGEGTAFKYEGDDIVSAFSTTGSKYSASFIHGLSVDEPLASFSPRDRTKSLAFFHGNHQGSIMAVSTKDRVIGRYSYSPYGVSQYEGESLVNAFQYTGREYDAEDLYYYRARYYDPTIGRFLSEDPIGFASGDSNFYRYVFNDPVNHTDPSGNVGIAGFGVGVVVDLGIQLALNGGNIRCVSLGQLAVAGALGAVGAIGVARVAALAKAGNATKEALRLPRAVGASVNITTRSLIKNSPFATRLAQKLSQGAQRDVDSLLSALRAGNANPGIGTRALGNGFFELRGRNAGRVIIKQTSSGAFDIIGKFQGHARGDAANSAIIQKLIGIGGG